MSMRQVEATPTVIYKYMFAEVSGVRFPIPFNTITYSEQHLIQKIIDNRRLGRHLIGEAKMPDRQTVILLSYLITCLIETHDPLNQPFTDHPHSQPDENTPKVILYLCKTEKRRHELLRIASRVYEYVNRALVKERGRTLFELESDTLCETKVIFKIWQGRSEEEREFQELMKSGKGALLRRLYFIPTIKFMESRLKKKEDAFWKKFYEYGFDTDSKDYYSFIKKVDLLFMESNDLEGIIQDFMTANLFEVHLHRANIEYRKLDKYYNYRQEEARKPKSTSNLKVPTKRDAEAYREANQSRKEKGRKGEAESKKKDQKPAPEKSDKAKPEKSGQTKLQGRDSSDSKIPEQKMEDLQLINERSLQLMTERSSDKKQKTWSIALLDRKFNELYIQKKSMLQNTRTGYSNTERLVQDYLDCYYLMNLQTIGYLISWLLVEWANEKFHESSDNSQNFINYIYSKTLLSSIVLRKLKRTFLAFVKKYPPKLQDTQLSYVYIEEVLNFFQKLVVWHQILSKSLGKDVVGQSSEGNVESANRLIVFREKVNKDSNLKVTTFDQKVFFELLSENMKWMCIMQNLAYSNDYFEHFFIRPQKLNLDYVYLCPRTMAEQCRHTTHGFIVTSTPNEEDLHIVSEKFQDIGKEMDDKKEDKELYSQIIRSYGVLIHDICELVPDGIVVYFPTRDILKECRAEWEIKENIYEKINKTKHIFEESEWEHENTLNLTKFKKYCKIGRGAVFFVSAQSEFAKLETFYGLYSRCIVMVGVPYHLHHLQAEHKLKFMGVNNHFRFEEAMKNVNRCLSNCINSPIEMKTVVLADIAYLRSDIRKKWFPFVEDANLNTLQVLDFISGISKKSSYLMRKKMQEEGRLVREGKKDNNADNMKRTNSDVSLSSFPN